MGALRVLAAFAIGLAALPGCATRSESVCDRQCECTKCSEAEHEDCVETLDVQEEQAQKAGCPGQYEDMLVCFEEKSKCEIAGFDVQQCQTEVTSWNACLAEAQANGGSTK